MISIAIPPEVTDRDERKRLYFKEYGKAWRNLKRDQLNARRRFLRKFGPNREKQLRKDREYHEKIRDEQPEKVRAQKKSFYDTHREDILKQQREAYSKNPRLKLDVSKRWYLANKDKKREYDKQYRLSLSPEKIAARRASQLAYYHAHPEKHAEWRKRGYECVRKWHKEHPDPLRGKRRRALIAQCKVDDTAEAFYKFVRSKSRIHCYYCGRVINGKDAHIDHVIAVSKRGNHASDNLAASCQKCNLKKHDKLPSEVTFLNQPLLNL